MSATSGRRRGPQHSGRRGPVSPPRLPVGPGSLPRALWWRGAVSWYTGAGISLLWLFNIGQEVATAATSAASAALGILFVVIFAAAFLASSPILWTRGYPGRLVVCGALFALTFTLFPWIGWGIAGAWTYVGVIVGMCVFPWRWTWPIITGLGVFALLAQGMSTGWSEDVAGAARGARRRARARTGGP